MAQTHLAQGSLHGFQHLLDLERFENIVFDALAERGHSQGLGPMKGHQNHRNMETFVPKCFQHLNARHLRHIHVEEN